MAVKFRFDDVCINADINLINGIRKIMVERVPGCVIIYAISPLVYSDCGERVYPEIFNAYSDYRKFYRPNRMGLPDILSHDVALASHGLVHVDHRLLTKEAQEMSILISCSLIGCRMFVPPFNKYNFLTEMVCHESAIDLVKFEDGWRGMEYNVYNSSHKLWYLHAREWTLEKITEWFDNKIV